MKNYLRSWNAFVVAAALCACTPAMAAPPAEKRTIKLPVVVSGVSATKARVVLQQAYAAIGIEVVLVSMPGERALIESTRGAMDGEIVRTALVEQDYPQLLRVPVPLYFFSISTLVRNEAGAVAPSLEDAQKMHRVGVVRGLKATEIAVRGWDNLTVANNVETALKMLRAKRFDVLVAPTEATLASMRTHNLPDDAFKLRTVMTMPAYHYLNQKNATLIPAIGAELTKLKGKQASVLDGIAAAPPTRQSNE
jgi:polar amino acid transport system substrate-binding protein